MMLGVYDYCRACETCNMFSSKHILKTSCDFINPTSIMSSYREHNFGEVAVENFHDSLPSTAPNFNINNHKYNKRTLE